MKISLTKLLVAISIVLPCAALAACGDDDETGSDGAATTAKKSDDAPKSDDEQSGDESSDDGEVLATKTAKGDFPAVATSATVEKPGTVKVRATPNPAKSTAVSTTIACRKGTKAGTDNDRFTVTSAETKTLKIPVSGANICNVSVSGQMNGKGSLKLEILGG